MSNVYITSDHHFYHNRIISYCSRPFADVDEMNAIMIDKWNSVVGKYDKVFHLGDFHLGRRESLKPICQSLNGNKILILGNHDRRSIARYFEAGFIQVYSYPIFYKQKYILSHNPVFLGENNPYFNIHGHLHNNTKCGIYEDGYYNVSVEVTDYKPVLFDSIERQIMERKMKCH